MIDESAKPSILHIDDSKDFLDIFAMTFKKQFSLTSVLSGQEALGKLRGNSYDLIISDYEMPLMDGLTLLKSIRQLHPDIPVIFLTGQGNERIAREAFINGASDYFTKDLYGFASKEKLANSINTLLKKRKAEQALHRTYETMRYIIKHDPNAIAVLDYNMNFVFVSDRFIDDYKLSERDIIGKNLYDIFPDMSDEMKEIHKEVLKGEIIRSEEDVTLKKPDGTTDYIRWEMRPWWETPDHIGGIVMYTEVITERKVTEIKLRQSEELYRKLVNTSPDSICITDMMGNITFASPRSYEMMGYSPEDGVIGTSPLAMVIPDDREAAMTNMIGVAKGEILGANEYRMFKKDGSLIYTEINTNPLYDDSGNIASVLSVIRDVSERKKNENRIVHLNKVLKAIRHVNQIIVHEKNLESLIQAICKTMIETRGYDFAWIILLDEKQNTDKVYGAGLNSSLEHIIEECRKGEIVNCLRKITAKEDPVCSAQINETCPTCPLKNIYRSNPGIVARIEHENKLYGYISVSVPEIITIDDEEKELFREVAGDVGYAIYNIKSTEEKRTTRLELKKERDLFKNYMDIAGVIMLALDHKGDITMINSRGCEILGYTEEELTGKNWFDICLPMDTREILREKYFNTVIGNRSGDHFHDRGSFTNHIINKNGELREISWHNALLRSVEGKSIGMLSSGLDITDLRMLEQDFAKDKHLMTSMFEISPVSIVVLDNEGVITYANPHAEDLLRIKKDSILSLSYNAPEFQITDFDGNPFPEEKLPFCIVKKTGKPVFDVEHCIVGHDGKSIFLSINAAPLFKPNGELEGMVSIIQDISTQVFIKRETEKIMDFYQTIIETTGTAIVVFGEDKVITYANSEMEKLSGYSMEEIVDKMQWTDFVTGSDLIKMSEYHRLRSEKPDKAPDKYDATLIRKSGLAENVMINITIIPNTNMRVASLINITQQKRSEALYKAMFENTAMAMVLFEEDTSIALVNREFEKLTGYMKEELEGILSWTDLVADEDLDRMFKYYQIKIITQDILPKQYSFKIKRRSGELRQIEATVAIIVQTNQRIASLVDVTKIKQTENNLLVSQKKLALSNKIANAFLTFQDEEKVKEALKIIIEVMGSETGLFGYIDDYNMLVCPSIIGKIPDHIIGLIDKDAICEVRDNSIWKKAIIEQTTIIINEEISDQTGQISIRRAIVSPVVYNKKTIGLLAMFNKEVDYCYEDEETLETICRQIAPILFSRSENQAKEKEKEDARLQLLKINKELNDFAYVVSHDLKSPLNLIKAQIQTAGEEPELFQEFYPRMIKQADYLLSFIDNILKLSRAGRIVEQKISINLKQLMLSKFELLRGEDSSCELEFVSDPPRMYADLQGMEQVFANLIQNSIRYRDPQKESLLICVNAYVKNDYTVIEYEDNGSGIEETVIDKIFNSGFTTSRKHGTGFGLSIARKIVEAHGGSIKVNSDGAGKGCRFIISIPVVEEEN